MRIFNWAKGFEERRTYGEILGRVRATETTYWLLVLVSVGLFLLGLTIFLAAPQDDLKTQLLGLLIAIEGSLWWAVVKIWVHIRLALYWILWDSRNRYLDEVNKMQSKDL